MAVKFIHWFWHKYKPREGWLLFGLMAFVLILAVRAVAAAEWVPNGRPIIWMTFAVSFGVSYLLAWRSAWGMIFRWTILLAYTTMASFLLFIRFRPHLIILYGWSIFQRNTELGWSILLARITTWLRLTQAGLSSDETLVFTFGLALLTATLTAFFIWQVYRHRRPLIAVGVLLVLLGFNNLYSGQGSLSLLSITVCAVFYVALWQQRFREIDWERQEIDYSAEMRGSNGVVALVIAVVLTFSGVILPSVPYSTIARRFQQSAVVQAFERSFERYFAGVNTTANRGGNGRGNGPGVAGAVGQIGPDGGDGLSGVSVPPAGVLPRAYLLGNPPELAETPVFAAEIFSDRPLSGSLHWRTGSFDIYTGRGWRQTPVVETVLLAADRPVPTQSTVLNGQNDLVIELDQTVQWLAPAPYFNLITLGQPLAFDQPVNVAIRPDGDLSHVSRLGTDEEAYRPIYRGTSVIIQRNRAILDQRPIDPDHPLYERYTALPSTVPERVISLAEQITAEATTPYEQAVAIERYLRQYTYNLDIDPIPADVDPVDYFLFDLQEGYCDLYASSMVVMARSLGLPARLGVGYLNSPAGENGQILITQDRGHSWAEIYFPEIGWVEFEPTAPFPISAAGDAVADGTAEDSLSQAPLLDLPEKTTTRTLPDVPMWLWGVLAAIGAFALFALRRTRRWRSVPSNTADLYRWLRDTAAQLGYLVQDSETAPEFGANFVRYLRHLQSAQAEQKQIDLQSLTADILALIALFNIDQYSPHGVGRPAFEQSLGRWRKVRRSLWRLWVQGQLSAVRKRPQGSSETAISQ